jgi:hypothetical protein
VAEFKAKKAQPRKRAGKEKKEIQMEFPISDSCHNLTVIIIFGIDRSVKFI